MQNQDRGSICTPRCEGGLGFRLSEQSNTAIHAKLTWQITSNEDRLWVKQLGRKYCRRHEFMNVEPNPLDSPQWKETLKGREIITKGRCMNVGNGKAINIWLDPWIPTIPDFKAKPKDIENINVTMVCDLITGNKWNDNLLAENFDSEIAMEIMKINISSDACDDKCIWAPNKLGNFTVTTACKIIQSDRQPDHTVFNATYLKKLWKLNANHRIKMLIWRISQGAIPTRDILKIRMSWIEEECLLCNGVVETRLRSLFQCPFAKLIWSQGMGLHAKGHNTWEIEYWLQACVHQGEKLGVSKEMVYQTQSRMAGIIDALWKERNHCLHMKCLADPMRVMTSLPRIIADADILSDHTSGEGDFINARGIVSQPYNAARTAHTFFTDVAVRPNGSHYAWVRMGPRNVVMEAGVSFSPSASPRVAECQAIRDVVKLIERYKLGNSTIFGDAKEVVEGIATGRHFPWSLSALLTDIEGISKKTCS